ncbi:MAG TPA: apolipoprotein N-acyltransferase [Frankiaceae bacterium]|nr:apolipoprotein N-acyltransferase [Frankiaceae bacterium]
MSVVPRAPTDPAVRGATRSPAEELGAPQAPQPPARRGRRTQLSRPTGRAPRWLRPVAAILAGVLLSVAFPPHDLWLLAPVAVAVLALVVRGIGLRAAYGLAFLFGLGFLVPLLAWSRAAGDDGWLILSVLQALFVALLGPLCTLAARLPATPLWVGTAWVLAEGVRDRLPFGGFPWARLAFIQPADGAVAPVTRLAALGGAPLVTFAVALVGGLLASAVLAVVRARRSASPSAGWRRAGLLPVGLALGAVLVLALGWAVPTPSSGETDPTGAGPPNATVAAVQGNVPRIGLDWMGQRRAVTRNHLARTRQLAADVAAGRVPAPDVVVWPENSSDLDPFDDPQAAVMLSDASRAIGRPLLVGAVLQGPGVGHVRNAGLIWGPDGYLGQMYVKRHPVPFGEYLPGRAILQRLVGRFADSLPNDFLPGKTPGLLTLTGPGGEYRIGDVICFEVAYDGIVRDVVDGHARLLVVQTNNATFGRSGETYQQMAMSRLRSIEHGRSTVVVATSGRSALIRPDGTVVAHSGLYTPDALVATLPLRSSTTIADHVGTWPEYALLALAVLGPAVLLGRRRARRGAASGDRPAGAPSGASDTERPDEAGSTA